MPLTLLTEDEDGRGRAGAVRGLLAGARILVVEDDADSRRLLAYVLAAAGTAEVTTVADGRDALERFQVVQPDLVVLDVHMPGADGLSVLAQLRAATSADDLVPVVIVTADRSPQVMGEALRAGANDFLTKPFDPEEVILRLRNLLETRTLHRRLQRHNAALAAQVWEQQARRRQEEEERRRRTARITDVLRRRAFEIHFQPIVHIPTRRPVAVEALARFTARPHRTPDRWFADASAAGLGPELEVAALRAALARLEDLPVGLVMTLNCSPEALASPLLRDALADVAADRVVVELTEHAVVRDYPRLEEALAWLRGRGVGLAVDDAGAGYASLRHILRLHPDLIKLDVALIRDIDSDPVRRALVSSLVAFAAETGPTLVAEGVETEAELGTLASLGVGLAQGYHLAAPAPLPLPPPPA